MTDLQSAEARLGAAVRERWDGGAVVDLSLRADAPLSDWRVRLDAGGEIVNLWNATILAREGTVYLLGAADYNAALSAGERVEFGFQVAGSAPVALLGLDTLAATAATPPDAAAQAGADAADDPPADEPAAGAMRLEAVTARILPPAPAVTVEGGTVPETAGSARGLPGREPLARPLATDGAAIVTADGAPVSIHGLNWFGLETEISAPHGLWARNWRAMMDEVRDLGFNALRIPVSGELVATGGGSPSGIDIALNPDLAGLDGLEILDAVVDYADTIGLLVLLDYHRGAAGAGPNESGLWFGPDRSEADLIAVWRTLAERYAEAPAVIGADLVNEPFGGTWGGGGPSDWAAAAERIGNAVLQIAPHWLIVVEGVAQYRGESYWWGGNLQGVADRPVVLDAPQRLVYSAHDYPASVHPQPWFFDGSDLLATFRENWGYIVEEGIAPVLVGEWGSFLATAGDRAWARALADYMDSLAIPWMWWSLNPNSRDTGGLYEDDWRTVRQSVLDLLDRFLADTRPAVTFEEMAAAARRATFTVSLEAPAEGDVVLKYATADGTATAGRDYLATAGSLVFAPGERVKEVTVPILPDADAEGDEFFYLVLGGSGALQGSATALVLDDDRGRRPAAQPHVDVASTIVGEGAALARFRVLLSEPAARDVVIAFATRAEGGSRREWGTTEGTLVIPAGEREALLEVSIGEDGAGERPGRFTLELTAADGATIRGGVATGELAPRPAAAAEVALARSATEDTQVLIDLILQDDWGSGALFNVVIRNVSDEAVGGWQIAMDLPFDIAELWDAFLVADEGARVRLSNADWNGEIGPGEAVDFGFIADAGGIALRQLLAAADIELALQ